MPLQETSHSLVADDGERIGARQWHATGTPRAIVQIAHGMGEHAGRYRPLADTLTRHGYAVWANDHRGHGPTALSEGRLGDFGPAGFGAVVSDMVRLGRFAREAQPGIPLILLGHSMGSFAAQRLMTDHGHTVDAVALSGTAALDLLVQARAQAPQSPDFNAGIANPRTPFDWLSRDPAVVDAYLADPLCGFTLKRESGLSLFAQAAYLAQPEKIQQIPRELPVYLFTGDHDPVNRHLAYFHPLVERYQRAGLTQVTHRIYEGARHEVLNETNRREVEDDLLAWLDGLPAQPTPPRA